MPRTLIVARNPDTDSSLPYRISVPVPGEALFLKVADRWPWTAKMYCHRSAPWPAHVEIVAEVPVLWCVRRGVTIDLILD